MVQGIFRVWFLCELHKSISLRESIRLIILFYREKMEESIDNSVNVKNRFPVFTQDVEANVSFQIDIGMINLKTEHKHRYINKQVTYQVEVNIHNPTLVLHLTLGAS